MNHFLYTWGGGLWFFFSTNYFLHFQNQTRISSLRQKIFKMSGENKIKKIPPVSIGPTLIYSFVLREHRKLWILGTIYCRAFVIRLWYGPTYDPGKTVVRGVTSTKPPPPPKKRRGGGGRFGGVHGDTWHGDNLKHISQDSGFQFPLNQDTILRTTSLFFFSSSDSFCGPLRPPYKWGEDIYCHWSNLILTRQIPSLTLRPDSGRKKTQI